MTKIHTAETMINNTTHLANMKFLTTLITKKSLPTNNNEYFTIIHYGQHPMYKKRQRISSIH